MQRLLFEMDGHPPITPFKAQLLKWIGNKQRYAHEIVAFFPEKFGTYFEPFLGGGGVLGTLASKAAVASDAFQPLIEIWQALHDAPDTLKQWYSERWHAVMGGDKVVQYKRSSRHTM